MSPHDGPPGWRDHPGVLHEKRDFSWTVVLGAAGVLLVTTVVVYLVSWGTFAYFRGRADRNNAEIAQAQPLTAREAQRPLYKRIQSVPPPRLEQLEPIRGKEPYIQSNQPERIWSPQVRPSDLKAERYRRLQTYGWVDQQRGIARIPIERAMEILVQSHQLNPEAGKKP